MNIQRDARVYADNREIGRVRHVIVAPDTREVTDIVVEGDGSVWQIPMSDVADADGDRVSLTERRLQSARSFDRDAYHAVDDERARDESRDRGTQARRGGAPLLNADENRVEVGEAGYPAPQSTPAIAMPMPLRTAAPTGSDYQLQLRAEQLRATAEREQLGTVSVSKRLVERVEQVAVTVHEERLVIEAHAGAGSVVVNGRELAAGETVEIVLTRERAAVSKEVVPVEDVVVTTQRTERVEHIEDTVRREELVVDDPQGLVEDRSAAQTAPRPTS